jgi:hypothetical protein
MIHTEKSDVHIGQQFLKRHIVWQIDQVKTVHGIPHVDLLQVGNSTERKLISVQALHEDYTPKIPAAL